MSSKLLGFKIFTDQLKNINFRKKVIINTINPHSLIVAKRDMVFHESLKSSTYLVPDGIGIVMAFLLIKNKLIKRITGFKVHEFLINKANYKGYKVFYFGSSNETLQAIKKKNNEFFPKLDIMYYSPPYKKEFTKSENNFFIKKINDFKPDILFVGMTAPKQEKWVYNNYKKIDCKIFSTIGAVFDFYAGRIKRAPQIFILLGLEWFYRFLQEPKRLIQRNFISAPKFLFYLFIEKIKNIFKSIFKPF